MARLKIGFRGAETVVSLGQGETTVGRANRCTINLPDPDLAAVHFRIRPRERGWQIKDDGSGIGTRVNGKPVYAKTLSHGDVIEAGGLTCVFMSRAAQKRTAAAPAAPAAVAAPVQAALHDEIDEVAEIDEPRLPERQHQPSIPTTWIVAGVALIAVSIFGWMLVQSQRRETEAKELWRAANVELDAARANGADATKRLQNAGAILAEIARDHGSSKVARAARGASDEVRRALSTLKLAQQEVSSVFTTDREATNALMGRLARLRVGAHPAVVARIEAMEEEYRNEVAARLAEGFDKTLRVANRALAEKRYAASLRAWRDYVAPTYSLGQRVKRAMAAIDREITKAYRATLRLAAERADLDSRIAVLEAARPTYLGTGSSDDLEVRISALRARRAQRDMVVIEPKKPVKESPEPGKPEPIVPSGPYQDPADVVTLIQSRAFGEAAATLRSISRHPDARTRVEELTMMATVLADLHAAIMAEPHKFTGVLLPEKRGRADIRSATENDFTAIDREKATVTVPWKAMSIKAYAKLFRQAGFDKPMRLETAVLLDELGLADEANKRYIAFFKSEQAPTTLTRILARRRGVKPPAEGFQLFRNALVTPAERDRTLLLEKIEKLGRQAHATNERRREEALLELKKLGEPAVETLVKAFQDRRHVVAEELKKSTAFRPGQFVSRLGSKLKKARSEALAFIRNPTLYPYPNKTKEAQERAEKLVDKVRAIWDQPYEALLAASDKAQALDAELKKLDQRLAEVDPIAVPIYETAVEEVQKRLDVWHIAIDGSDSGRIAYNDAVKKYNLELPNTTVDVEERANTRAVNEYRWMMGLRSVKIDERLVRASRKHSIEMQQEEYFAHESPTPRLRNPTLRARREGYPGGVAENIARGASSGVQAFEQWFGSSGHHRNMLSPGHTEMGCGAARHHWWTQKFGNATGRSLNPPKVPPDPDPPGASGNGKPAPK